MGGGTGTLINGGLKEGHGRYGMVWLMLMWLFTTGLVGKVLVVFVLYGRGWDEK